MTPFQQLYLGLGAKKKIYVDDVFANYLYKGTNGANTITNGINNSGEGGMLWVKARTSARNHMLFDTVRGVNKKLSSNLNEVEDNQTPLNQTFTSSGFTWNTSYTDVNDNNVDYVSHNFRKAKGFFDIVSYTGTGSSRTIAHSLGCVPGLIMIKRTDTAADWQVYHRHGGDLFSSNGHEYNLELNSTDSRNGSSTVWHNTAPTSTNFSLGTGSSGIDVNVNSGTYIAYLWAGGESTAATARSVGFNQVNTWLTIASSDKFDVETNWTAECWFKAEHISGSFDVIMGIWDGNNEWLIEYVGAALRFYYASGGSTSYKSFGTPPKGQWHHVAVSKEGSNTRIFLNGAQVGEPFDMGTKDSSGIFGIGTFGGAGLFKGSISNVRIVKGTAVYTSSFIPPTAPLENITNTELLCCNNSSTTGGLKIPGSISSNGGNAMARTDSPFDDPGCFVFGENGDQNIVKTGGYLGTGANLDVYIGFEPAYLLVKRSTGSADSWYLADTMRGMSEAYSKRLNADLAEADATRTGDFIVRSTGFTAKADGQFNADGETFVYLAIRRPDGYVGKPIDTATDVFTTAASNSGSSPGFTSGFPVDFYIYRKPTASSGWQSDWNAYLRLLAKNKSYLNKSDVEGSDSSALFHFNTGVQDYNGFDTSFNAWMWRRHKGMDCVIYKGNGAFRGIQHSLGVAPEMMIIKRRNATKQWYVYHSGINGSGGSPENYSLRLSNNDAKDSDGDDNWNQTAPTASHFFLKTGSGVNADGDKYLALLFSSIAGISKVGYYTGNGSASGPTVTLGFQPRFLLVKCTTDTTDWQMVDTVRGWGSGNDKTIYPNSNAAENSSEVGAPTSTGFTIAATFGSWNASGGNYVYYAHA